MIDEIESQTPAPDPQSSRRVLTWVALVIGVLAIIWAGYLQLSTKQQAVDTQGALNAKDNQAQTLADQVQAACAKGGDTARSLGAACAKAGEIKDSPPPAPEAGPKGEIGAPGPSGPPGPTGVQGIRGEDGPQGAQGTPGSPGADGNPGLDGKDGAQGQTGPPGPAGEPGPPGANGGSGADGQDGAPGKPPSSWSWTDPLTGTRYDCTRSNTNDEAPTYACG